MDGNLTEEFWESLDKRQGRSLTGIARLRSYRKGRGLDYERKK